MKANKICEYISVLVQNNELSNDDLVQIIEHAGSFLNLKTISDYSRDNNISYNAAKKYRSLREIFNVRFVIDNE